MRVISKSRLDQAIKNYPELAMPLMAWYKVIKKTTFNTFEALRTVYPSADLVGRTTVFNMKGNHYRLITAIHYNTQTLFVLEVLTHAEYSKNIWKKAYDVDS